MNFPSLVGGTLVREDYAPSILFAILFGCLVPLAAFRLLDKTSRTTLLIGTIAFTIERVVIFSFRAIQSRNQARAGSHSLAKYEQLTIGMGYIGICQDLVNFLRVLLVNSTRSIEHGTEQKLDSDNPRARSRYRSLSGLLSLAFLSAIVPGVISGSSYPEGIDDADVAKRVMNLRYASTGVALLLTVTVGATALVASYKVSRVNSRPASILATLAGLLSVVAVYRLSVMHNTTDSLLSRGPGSLSSPAAKSTFYIFHMLPEWIASAVLICMNSRRVFNTGPFGDWRSSDKETKWERRRRERKEREATRGAQGNNDVPMV